ncbi:MAG TPA: amidohydrolase [Thermomicrobiales bacterium]|nr:amidohydrolase [Thermomicrobiales bacterium]
MIARTLQNDVDEILPGVIADRRHLHEHPELAFQEVETAKFVAARLEALGVEDIRTGIAVTGVTGLIRGTKPGAGRTVLLRADMDALPIHEENTVEYASTADGVMHACGHDAHTAILLGVARLLVDRRDTFAGTVKLCFQPAEEAPPGGAIRMIGEGVLEDPHVDAVFALHVSSGDPAGTVRIGPGPFMAGGDLFVIEVQGKGGHGASPEETVDPIVIGAQIVTALQTLVSRETDPMETVVVSTGTFQAGDAINVIPDSVMIGGTVRTFDPELLDRTNRRIGELASSIAGAMGGTAKTTIPKGYPPTVNDAAMAEIVREAAVEVVGEEKVLPADPKMGGEDFAHFLRHRPGAYFNVGARNETRGIVWGHHHPRFDVDEECLGVGMSTMVTTALRYLKGE